MIQAGEHTFIEKKPRNFQRAPISESDRRMGGGQYLDKLFTCLACGEVRGIVENGELLKLDPTTDVWSRIVEQHIIEGEKHD